MNPAGPDDLVTVLRDATGEPRAVRSEITVLRKKARGNRRATGVLTSLVALVIIGTAVTLAILQVHNAAVAAELRRANAAAAAVAAVKAEDYKLCETGNMYRAREKAALTGPRGALSGPPWEATPASRAYAARLKVAVAQFTAPRDCAHL